MIQGNPNDSGLTISPVPMVRMCVVRVCGWALGFACSLLGTQTLCSNLAELLVVGSPVLAHFCLFDTRVLCWGLHSPG